MMIQQPILWATLCFIGGILLGHYVPSWIYLFFSTATLLLLTILRHRKHTFMLLAMAFWFALGGARTNLPLSHTSMQTIKERTGPVREKIIARLTESGINDESISLSSALLTGDKDLLGKDMRKAYSRAGASHLLALSGMHLGIIYGLIYMLLLRWMRFSRWKWHMLPIVLLCLWGYALVAGLPFSLLRATIMLSVFTIGTLAQYRQPSLHTLSLSALCILLISPMALFDIGFQLSFTAVFFIIVLYPTLNVFFKEKRLQWIWEMLGVSFAAQLGTAPLCMYYFHILPYTGFILSLFVVPITMVIIYMGMITLICPWQGFGFILEYCIKAQVWCVNIWGNIPYTVVENLHPKWWQVCILYVLFLVFSLRIKAKTRQLFLLKHQ